MKKTNINKTRITINFLQANKTLLTIGVVLFFSFGLFSSAYAVLDASCIASPSPAQMNQTVNFTSSVSGGTGSYTYTWRGACLGESANCVNSFSSSGLYTALLTIDSGSEEILRSCGVQVVVPCITHTSKACYDSDVYWYDSCSQKEEKSDECGANACQSGQCQAATLNVSASVSPNPANPNQTVTFTASPTGGTGSYSYNWSGACTGTSQSCQTSFANAGTYIANIIVYSANQSKSSSAGVTVSQSCTSHAYKACFDGDAYWYDSCGNRQEKAEECGTNNCSNGQCQAVDFSVSCSVNPNPVNINQTALFTASPTGGTGSYSYNWSGACNGSSQNCSNSFPISGTYIAYLTATSGSQTRSANCSLSVSQQQCQGHSYRACYDGDVYWYNSCSQREEKIEDCYSNNCSQGQCSSASDLTVSCSASPNPASTNQTVSFNPSVYGGTGNYTYNWTGACYGYSSSCSNSFSIAGTQTAYLTVTSGSQTRTANCSANIQSQSNRSFVCYDNDVYWYDSYLGRQEKSQDCGETSSCVNTGSYYCTGNSVYVQQTCYTKGCAIGACFNNPGSSISQLVQNCASNQTCQNGQCINTNYQQCSSGTCCDNNGQIKSAGSICNTETQTEYGCYWGTGCGVDVSKRTKTRYQYCSGSNSACTGSWSDWSIFSNWITADYCSSAERCVAGNSTCQASSSCSNSGYIKYYKKSCYGDSLYWYDSSNIRQSLYKNCDDNNQCTVDKCQGTGCVNEAKCDLETCQKGSEDYCQSCYHNGDGVCNCGETAENSNDCKASLTSVCPSSASGIIVSILAKKGKDTTQWSKTVDLAKKESFDLLVILTNESSQTLNNVSLNVAFPAEINYTGSLKVDGSVSTADIESGINVGSLNPKEVKTLTFGGKAIDLEGETIITARATSNSYSATDSLKVNVSKSQVELATIGGVFSTLFGRGYAFPLLLIITIIIIILVLRAAYFSLKKV